MPLPQIFLDRPIAHRALHDAPSGIIENSLSAVKAAIDHGYGIEIDVQLTSDNQAVMFHDPTLDRLTDQTGKIRDHSLAALTQIPLTGSTDTIPPLCDVLNLVNGAVPLVIELKDQTGHLGESDGVLERAVLDALAAYDGPVAVMSFNPHMVKTLHAAAPDLPCGLVTASFPMEKIAALNLTQDYIDALRAIAFFDQIGADFISHEAADLARAPVAALKARGVPILCWTVKDRQTETTARHIADNITFEGYLA